VSELSDGRESMSERHERCCVRAGGGAEDWTQGGCRAEGGDGRERDNSITGVLKEIDL
jgi:hypothetical protein